MTGEREKIEQEALWRLASIVRSTGDAIISVSLDRIVTSWNPGAEKVFGYAADEVIGRPVQSTIPPHRAEEARGIVARVLAGEVVDQVETERVRKDGTIFPIVLTVSPIIDDSGAIIGIASIARDISQRKKVEAELRERELVERMREGQKLAALGTLAGGVAHDFNNLLVPILALTKLTARRLPEGSLERGNLDQVAAAAERARNLVRQILAFSRSEAPALAPCDLCPVVAEGLRLLRSTLPTTIAIDAALPQAGLWLHGDGNQIGQVLMNLCANAAQAIGDRHGRIAIRLAAHRVAAELPAHAGVVAPGDYLLLAIEDDGAGMDKATLARAFEPFYTTKAVGEGTGLGLAVVHGIVKSHGGAIVVESRPGEGTRFRLYFPALPAPEGASAPAEENA